MSMFDDVLGMGRTSSIIEGAIEPEVEEITMESVDDVPDYMEPMEFMTQVACEQELNMQRLDMAIMAEEYVYLRENGEEMVTEAGTIQNIIDKFKKGVDWLWSKITTFFKTVQKKLQDAIKLDDRFLEKYADAKKCKTKIKISTGFEDTNTDHTFMVGDALFVGMATIAATVYTNIGATQKKTADEILEKYNKELFGSAHLKAGKGESSTAKNIMKKFYKDLTDSDSTAVKDREFDPKDAFADFKKSKESKEKLKKSYASNKKIINTFYKAAKKMESVTKKGRVIPTDESKNIHVSVKILNKIGKDITIVDKTMVKVINAKRSLAKQIIVRAATAESKDVKQAGKDLGKNAAKLVKNMEKVQGESFIESVEFGELW